MTALLVAILIVALVFISAWTFLSNDGLLRSARGCATTEVDRTRVTVFPRDGGWKYCIAKADNDPHPILSNIYPNDREARHEGLVAIGLLENRYISPRVGRMKKSAEANAINAPLLFVRARNLLTLSGELKKLPEGSSGCGDDLAKLLFACGDQLNRMNDDLREIGEYNTADEAQDLFQKTRYAWLDLQTKGTTNQ